MIVFNTNNNNPQIQINQLKEFRINHQLNKKYQKLKSIFDKFIKIISGLIDLKFD